VRSPKGSPMSRDSALGYLSADQKQAVRMPKCMLQSGRSCNREVLHFPIGVLHAHLIDVLYLSFTKEIVHEAMLDALCRQFFGSFSRVCTERAISSAVK
jgi:hypothetical protein